MISAKIDRGKLERSLRRYAKEMGDTHAQAVARWGVQTCRELAFETQPWGKSGTKKKQESTVWQDARNVIVTVDRLPRSQRNSKVIRDAGGVVDWMDQNRGKGKRTKHLPIHERHITTEKILKKAVREIMKRAGIAKGGFLGAGQDIARAQKGSRRINIGKNYLSYAQKHSRYGDAVRPVPGWRTRATLRNRARHSGESYVLKPAAILSATNHGLRKTVQWYRKAVRAQNRKQKP